MGRDSRHGAALLLLSPSRGLLNSAGCLPSGHFHRENLPQHGLGEMSIKLFLWGPRRRTKKTASGSRR